jgi:hypothetical protein
LAANAYLPATEFWVPAFAGMTKQTLGDRYS